MLHVTKGQINIFKTLNVFLFGPNYCQNDYFNKILSVKPLPLIPTQKLQVITPCKQSNAM